MPKVGPRVRIHFAPAASQERTVRLPGTTTARGPPTRFDCYTMQTANLRRSRALRLSMLGWSLNAPLLSTSGGGYGEVGARDPSAKTRDRMMEYVGEAMDD